MTRPFAIAALALALTALAAPRARAVAACTNPGQDGPVSMSGVVNSYYPGVSASAGASSLVVGAVDTSSGGLSTALGAGDLIVVMQMQDADIASSNDSSYGGSSPGSGQIALNNAGVYEYATIAITYAGGATIPLTAPLTNSYRNQAASGGNGQRRFQVIRVPQYSAVTMTGTATTPPWNGATGGVLVFDVGGQLNWNGQTLDVTGRGFRGGGGLYMKGRDAAQAAFATTDYVSNLAGFLPVLATNPSATPGPFRGSHAVKGEGIAGTPRYLFVPTTVGAATNGAGSLYDTGIEGYPGGSLARGAPGNAGGGGTDGDPAVAWNTGNDQNTGGGGGGGYAGGGMGGYGWTPGTPPGSQTGGYGGDGVPMGTGRLTLGGGGGAGTSNNGTGTPNYGLASSGAPGGGLVLVRAKTVIGTGTINARGTAGNPSVCNDASGGGGGGGAAMVYASGNSGALGTLTINVNGGAGGSNTGNGSENSSTCGAFNQQPHGPGGGGGGGFVALSTSAGVTINVAGGANGTTSPSATSTSPYGSSSSPGGYQINTVVSTDLPGATASPLCFPRLTVNKVTTKADTVQGGTTAYTVTVTNTAGYGTATGVTLRDILPSPLSLVSTDAVTVAGGASRPVTSNPVAGATSPVWSAFSIPGGGSVTVSFTGNVPAGTPLGVLQNAASVDYDDPTRSSAGQTVTPGGNYSTGGFVLGSNYLGGSSAGEDVTVRQPAAVSKGFSPVSIAAAGTSQLSIIVTNPNAVAVTSAAFTDAFPAGLTAVGGPVTVSGAGCSGFTPASVVAGATSFAQSGGTVPAGGTCAFSIDVSAGTLASYTNTLPAGAFTNNLNVINVAPASATLLGRPTIAKSFSPSAVAQNAAATVSFAIANPNSSQQLTNASFSDTFPAGLTAVGGAVTVSGAGCTAFAPASVVANATAFNLTAGTLPAATTCTVSFAVTSSTAGAYANTAGGVSTTETVVAGPGSNTAQLGVGEIGIAEAFSPAQIRSGGTSTVTLTLTNPTGVAQIGGAFSDTLSGMSISANQTAGGTCTGVTPPALTAGQTSLAFTGINIPAAGCTISFVVTSASVGSQTNAAGGVSTLLLPQGPPATAATLVVTGPPTIAKAFTPGTIQAGAVSTVTFTLTNGDTIPLTGAGFTDTLVAALSVAGAGTVAASGTCPGASSNTFTAGVAGATLTFTGLTIPQGVSGCTVTVPVTSNANSAAAGYANTTSGVSSVEAATGSVSNTARLIVATAPTIAKAFGTSPIAQGGTSVLTFTLSNSSAIALTGGAFTDVLTNMQVSAAGPAGGTCAGASANSFSAGQTGTLGFTGLTIPAAGSCTVTVTVTSNTSGTNANTASGVTTNETPVAGAASNTANLVVYSPPTVSLGFTPGVILSSTALATSRTTLTITLTNGNAAALTGVSFSDTLSSMQIYATAAAGGTCTGAAGNSFTAGATSLSFTGITVPASGSCTVTVQVASPNLSPAAGWPNATSGAASTQTPLAGVAPSPAYLTVLGYATIGKLFSPASIASGGTSTLTFTLTNPNAVPLSSAGFSDAFPANLTTSGVAQNYIGAGRGTCTGAVPSADATTRTTVTFAGIAIPANSSCTVTVDVTSGTNGSYANTASGVTAAETGATAGPVSNTATLAVGRISIVKAFAPSAIGVGEKTSLSLVLTSSYNTTRSALVFTDSFPAGMTVASPLNVTNSCGGTIRNVGNTANTAVGDGGLSLQGGSLTAGASCTITVDVATSGAGSFANTTSATSGGGVGPVSNTATLVVTQKATIAKAFSPTPVDAYRNTTLTFTVTNPNASPLTNCTFTDTLTGFAVGSPPSIGGTCTGTTNTPALSTGAVALNLKVPTLSAGSCTVTVPVTSPNAGTYSNTASGVQCDQAISAGAASNTATVTFAKLPIQFLKSANVVQASPGTTVTYTISYANPNTTMPLQNIVITDATPQFTGFASAACGVLPASLTTCTIGAPAAGASGTVTWTLAGSLDPGASGTVTLTVTVK